MKIIKLATVDSTNEYAKRADCGEDMIVTAKRQTSGKGTKGRSFASDKGGLYITVLKHFNGMPAARAFEIMINSCVAVCATLQSLGLKPVIRWANDVLVGGKKISGTLIENNFSDGFIARSVTGIGININNRLPAELSAIAVSVKEILKKKQNIDKVTNLLIENLQKEYTVDNYKQYIDWFGREITLKINGDVKICRAADVAADGSLICEKDGVTFAVSCAEVSLRI